MENYVIFPRYLINDLRSGKMNATEYIVLCYIRNQADPWASSYISLKNVNDDLFNGRNTINYCNQIVLALKKKRYIHFLDRRGKKGSFEVKLDYFLLPSRKIYRIDKNLQVEAQAQYRPSVEISAEQAKNFMSSIQMPKDVKSALVEGSFPEECDTENRGYNTKNNNDNDTNNILDMSFRKQVIDQVILELGETSRDTFCRCVEALSDPMIEKLWLQYKASGDYKSGPSVRGFKELFGL